MAIKDFREKAATLLATLFLVMFLVGGFSLEILFVLGGLAGMTASITVGVWPARHS